MPIQCKNTPISSDSDKSLFDRRYRVIEEIGRGGNGIVYRVHDILNNQFLALKKLHSEHSTTTYSETIDKIQMALAHEFQTIATLRHPNIISVVDYGFDLTSTNTSQPYFVMEYIKTSQDIVKAGYTKNISEKLNLVLQMLQALSYLHRRNILHLDLKPANVLYNGDAIKVVDFGLATKIGQTSNTSGTLPYIAPERLLGKQPTFASDLFSAGVILYEILTDTHPFNFGALDTNQFLNKLLKSHANLEPIESLTFNDPDWENWLLNTHVEDFARNHLIYMIGRLLDQDPDFRYSDTASVIKDLLILLPPSTNIEPPEIRESFIQAANFVGRESESSQLKSRVDDIFHKGGQVVLVGGESGIGKSRLVDEVRVYALVNGALVLTGKVQKQGGGAYGFWRPILRQLILLVEISDSEASILKPLIPDIDRLLNRIIPDAPLSDTQETHQRLVLTITSLIRRYNEPVVIVIEDLQWVEENLEILQNIAQTVKSMKMLLIGTYRNDESANLPEKIPQAEVIILKRLNKDDIQELSVSILGSAGSQSRIINLLHRETEGNVFFLVEVMRSLAQVAGNLGNIASMELPAKVFARGIRDIVEQRLHQVPHYAKQLLQLAAVMGRELNLKLLQTLLDNNYATLPIKLDLWLTVCSEAAILDVKQDRWQFTHDQVREGILEGLKPAKQKLFHRYVAEVIEITYPENNDLASALAYHWKLAENDKKEFHYVVQAAKHATEFGISYEVTSFLQRGLQLYLSLEINDPEWLAKSYYQLGRAYTYKGEYEDASKYYAYSFTELQNIDNIILVADVIKGQAHLPLWQGKLDEAQEYSYRLLEFAIQNDLITHQIDAHNYLNAIFMMENEDKLASHHINTAWKLVKDIQDPWRKIIIKNAMGEFSAHLKCFDEALLHYEDALIGLKSLDNQYARTAVLINMAHCYLETHDIKSAKEFYIEALKTIVLVPDMLPLGLATIAGFSQIRISEEKYENASMLVGLVINNPYGYHDSRRMAEVAIEQIKQSIDTETYNKLATQYTMDNYYDILHGLINDE